MRPWVLAGRGALAALCLMLPSVLPAQSTGVISGRVLDRDGSPLAGVTVALSIPDAPGRGEVTDGGGSFRFSSLAGGSGYTIEASFPGLAPVILDVQVEAGRVTPLNIIMQPAEELTERVRVSARPQIVDLGSTTTETSFSSEFVESLPILGRN